MNIVGLTDRVGVAHHAGGLHLHASIRESNHKGYTKLDLQLCIVNVPTLRYFGRLSNHRLRVRLKKMHNEQLNLALLIMQYQSKQLIMHLHSPNAELVVSELVVSELAELPNYRSIGSQAIHQ